MPPPPDQACESILKSLNQIHKYASGQWGIRLLLGPSPLFGYFMLLLDFFNREITGNKRAKSLQLRSPAGFRHCGSIPVSPLSS